MHLTEEQILTILEQKMTAGERSMVYSHLADCPVCSEKLASAQIILNSINKIPAPKIDKNTILKAEGLVRNSEEVKTNNNFIKFAVPGLTIIFIAALFYFFNNEEPASKYRSGNNSGPVNILQPLDESVLHKENMNFKWNSVAGAFAYRYLLFKEDGTPVSSSLLKDTNYLLKDTGVLTSGNKYLWRIEIIFPDETKQRSELQTFTYEE